LDSQSFPRGFSQIWLHVREKSKKNIVARTYSLKMMISTLFSSKCDELGGFFFPENPV
jgi:hypothetical protein